jgi:hypothetical protein
MRRLECPLDGGEERKIRKDAHTEGNKQTDLAHHIEKMHTTKQDSKADFYIKVK